jgi:signal transduction histidine kinase
MTSPPPAGPPERSEFTRIALREQEDLVWLCRGTRAAARRAGLDRWAAQRLSTAAYEVADVFLRVGPAPPATAIVAITDEPALEIDVRADLPPSQRPQLEERLRPLRAIVHRVSLDGDGGETAVRLAMFVPATVRPGAGDDEHDEGPADGRSHREVQAELHEANCGLVALYAELEDRTERLKEAEHDLARRAEELAAANRAKEEFLATLSHELRTPLNAMLGWTRLLRSGRLEGEVAARALETIERNARLQEQLIADILDVSRIVTGKLRVELRPLELAPLVEAAVDAVRPAGDAKGVALTTTISDEPREVLGDADRLQQVFWNLLANAIKFTQAGGTVAVTLEPREGAMVVTVRDTGEGIPPDLLPYIFNRFWQGDASVTRPHGGLGLGLSIVRHIVELHGGEATVASDGPGCGSTFAVSLPVH